MTNNNKKLYKAMATYAVLSILSTISLYFALASIQDALIQQEQEGKCIARHIANGIERKDIIAHNGTCSLRVYKD